MTEQSYLCDLQLALNLIGFMVVVSQLVHKNQIQVVFVLRHPLHACVVWLVRLALFLVVFMTDLAALFVVPLVYWTLKANSVQRGFYKCLEWLELTISIWALYITRHFGQYAIGIHLKRFALSPSEVAGVFPKRLEYLALELLRRHELHS